MNSEMMFALDEQEIEAVSGGAESVTPAVVDGWIKALPGLYSDAIDSLSDMMCIATKKC